MEKSTGVESSIEVKPSFGLDEGKIASMIKDSMSNAKEDIDARMLKEQQVEASRVIESVQAALNADKGLLSADELDEIQTALSTLANVSQTQATNNIEKQIDKVNQVTATFAERRMDASIRDALAGQSVDEV